MSDNDDTLSSDRKRRHPHRHRHRHRHSTSTIRTTSTFESTSWPSTTVGNSSISARTTRRRPKMNLYTEYECASPFKEHYCLAGRCKMIRSNIAAGMVIGPVCDCNMGRAGNRCQYMEYEPVGAYVPKAVVKQVYTPDPGRWVGAGFLIGLLLVCGLVITLSIWKKNRPKVQDNNCQRPSNVNVTLVIEDDHVSNSSENQIMAISNCSARSERQKNRNYLQQLLRLSFEKKPASPIQRSPARVDGRSFHHWIFLEDEQGSDRRTNQPVVI